MQLYCVKLFMKNVCIYILHAKHLIILLYSPFHTYIQAHAAMGAQLPFKAALTRPSRAMQGLTLQLDDKDLLLLSHSHFL